MAVTSDGDDGSARTVEDSAAPPRRDRTHWLYLAVIAAVLLGNFAGNAVATLLIGHWVGELDHEQARRVFAGDDPFDEALMVDDHESVREEAPA